MKKLLLKPVFITGLIFGENYTKNEASKEKSIMYDIYR